MMDIEKLLNRGVEVIEAGAWSDLDLVIDQIVDLARQSVDAAAVAVYLSDHRSIAWGCP